MDREVQNQLSEFNSKTVALNLDREVLHLFVDYDRRWRSSRLGIVCADGINDRLNGVVLYVVSHQYVLTIANHDDPICLARNALQPLKP